MKLSRTRTPQAPRSLRCAAALAVLVLLSAGARPRAQDVNHSVQCQASAAASIGAFGSLVGAADAVRDGDPGTALKFQGSFTLVGAYLDGVATVDFGAVVDVSRVEIVHGCPGTGSGTWAVSVRSGGAWQTVLSGSGNFGTKTDAADVAVADADAVRVEGSGGGGSLTVSDYFIYELRAFGPAPGGGGDCDGDGLLDACELSSGSAQDCNGDGVPDDCEGAVETSRPGSPPNPDALLPGQTSGPVLGAVWDPVIDHASFQPGAVLDVLVLTALPANQPSPLGTVLCDAATPPLLFSGPPGVPFALPVPASCSLLGKGLCVQGASVDAVSIALTNALDVTFGTF